MSADDALSALDKAQASFDAATAATPVAGLSQPWSPEIVRYLSISVLAFTGIALVLCTALLWRMNATAQHVLKVFGVLTIIGMSAVLLVVGFSNAQLTPIVGLFGAIAGYLLGRDASESPPKPPSASGPPSPPAA